MLFVISADNLDFSQNSWCTMLKCDSKDSGKTKKTGEQSNADKL